MQRLRMALSEERDLLEIERRVIDRYGRVIGFYPLHIRWFRDVQDTLMITGTTTIQSLAAKADAHGSVLKPLILVFTGSDRKKRKGDWISHQN
jgi:hypothetical protein